MRSEAAIRAAMADAGWRVDVAWPFRPIRYLRREAFDVIGLSVSGPRDFEWAVDFSERLHRERPEAPLLVGGHGAEQLLLDTGICSRGQGHGTILA